MTLPLPVTGPSVDPTVVTIIAPPSADNALIRDAEDTVARSTEYRAVEGTVPTRLPSEL
jgi:hypothetical protein